MKKILKNIFLFSILLLQLFLLACKKDNDDDIVPDTPDAFVTAIEDDINADSIRANVQWMQNYTTRFFLNNNRKQIATDIKNKFIHLGYPDTRIDSFSLTADWNSTTYYTWQYNVIARLQGNSSPENIYVIGAHYDCMVDEGDPFTNAPGANDNASGIAGLVEIARVMKKHSFTPKNTIEFVAFASEEYELNGSADYANKATNIVMMLNNDMTAYEPNTDPTGWTVNVMDYSNSSDLRTMFVKCGKTYTALNFANDNEYNQDGDSYSFFDKGFKAVFIISNTEDSYYHTIDDVWNNYNYNYCKEVTSVSCALLVKENK
ncbi:MAG TPA: M28 family metallopeptidase [Bacteroidales bacterium]|nr:M28 family metallopeptidase [Bacteroidales bacterium]